MQSAIAYFVFNRPHHTKQSFSVLRNQRPSQLFLIADGPRPEYADDQQRCAAVRAIVEEVDWPCEVYRNYAEVNLGLKQRVSSGLDWVFERADRAIILEDDCVAHPDFFRFCDALLEHYADDERIAVVTGNNFQNGQRRGEASYYFSKYNHCWGWATWQRAWKHYQGDLAFWPDWHVSDAWLTQVPDKAERNYWHNIFERVHADKIDSWAYPWTASVWYHNGLTATPNVNLVSNIGFGPDSTHTASSDSHLAALATTSLENISHPKSIVADVAADRYAFERVFGGGGWRSRGPLTRLIYRILISAYRRLKRSAAPDLPL